MTFVLKFSFIAEFDEEIADYAMLTKLIIKNGVTGIVVYIKNYFNKLYYWKLILFPFSSGFHRLISRLNLEGVMADLIVI